MKKLIDLLLGWLSKIFPPEYDWRADLAQALGPRQWTNHSIHGAIGIGIGAVVGYIFAGWNANAAWYAALVTVAAVAFAKEWMEGKLAHVRNKDPHFFDSTFDVAGWIIGSAPGIKFALALREYGWLIWVFGGAVAATAAFIICKRRNAGPKEAS